MPTNLGLLLSGVLISQFEIINFCLTFTVTGVHFLEDLNYFGHMG